jgi:hypothetical protein
MLAAATSKKQRKPKIEIIESTFNARTVYETIRNKCGHNLACEPFRRKWLEILNREVKGIQGLEPQDIDRLCGWINSGALKDWPVTPTFGDCAKHFASWVVRARKWSAPVSAKKISDAFKK